MRLTFAGGLTDLPPHVPGLGGRVVGSAIERRVHVELAAFDPGWISIEAGDGRFNLLRRETTPPSSHSSARLVEAALKRFGIRSGARVRITSDTYVGSGLGASGATGVALIAALRASLGRMPADPAWVATEVVELERSFGNQCGTQDPMFATEGGLLDILYDDEGRASFRSIAPSAAFKSTFEAGLLLVDTRVARQSGRALPEKLDARAKAELVEAAMQAARALQDEDLDALLGAMLRSAFAKMRSAPLSSQLAVDLWHGLEPMGARVVRTCGAGGGGHLLVWADPSDHPRIIDAVRPFRVMPVRVAAEGVRVETV